MDTFMDKLAQRFTAQEMIKANSAAEAQEMSRLKEQVKEYTECLNHMKKLCAEMEQTAAAAKDKMDSAQVNVDGLKELLTEIRENMQMPAAEDNEGNYSMESRLAEMLVEMLGAQDAQLENIKEAQNVQLENIKSAQNDQLNNIRNIQAELLDDVKEIQQVQMSSIKGLQETQVDSLKTAMEDQLDSMRSMIKAQISTVKNGQDGQLDNVRMALESQNETLNAQIGEMKTNMETQMGGFNEFVHKECVKVYRNVQAVVSEENSKQSENLDFSFKPIDAKVKKVNSVATIAAIFSLISVVLQVLSMLKILPF